MSHYLPFLILAFVIAASSGLTAAISIRRDRRNSR